MSDSQRQLDTRALELAVAAQTAIASHERVCSERQLAILGKFDDNKADRDAFRKEAAGFMREIRSLVIKVAIAIIGGLLMAVVYFLNLYGLPGVH